MTATEAFEFVPSFLLMMVTVGGVYVLLMRAGVNRIEVQTSQAVLIGKGWESERKERENYALKYERALQEMGEMKAELGRLRAEVARIPSLEATLHEITGKLRRTEELVEIERGLRVEAENQIAELKRQIEDMKRQIEAER